MDDAHSKVGLGVGLRHGQLLALEEGGVSRVSRASRASRVSRVSRVSRASRVSRVSRVSGAMRLNMAMKTNNMVNNLKLRE